MGAPGIQAEAAASGMARSTAAAQNQVTFTAYLESEGYYSAGEQAQDFVAWYVPHHFDSYSCQPISVNHGRDTLVSCTGTPRHKEDAAKRWMAMVARFNTEVVMKTAARYCKAHGNPERVKVRDSRLPCEHHRPKTSLWGYAR